MPETVVYVDLDRTLVREDTLLTSLVTLLSRKPWIAALLPMWTLDGKAAFKQRVSQHAPIDASRLTYHDAVLEFLRDKKQRGHVIVLATAADRSIARAVADHLGLFSDFLSSDGVLNLSGIRKLEAIRQHAGHRPFEYLGDSAIDIPIWNCAESAYRVCRDGSIVPWSDD